MKSTRALIVAFTFILISCGGRKEKSALSSDYCIQSFAQTFPLSNGNRSIDAAGDIDWKSFDIPLNGQPMWIVGLQLDGTHFWAVVLESGVVEAIETSDGKVLSHNHNWGKVSAGTPPVIGVDCDGKPMLVNELVDNTGLYAAPIPLPNKGLAFISSSGDLVISNEKGTTKLALNAMHDSRIMMDDKQRLLVLTNPQEYQHQVLGDGTEARGVAIVETIPEIAIVSQFMAPDSSVIEAISVIWEDIDGDGKREIATTLSNNTEGVGGKHVLFSEEGKMLASGKSVKPDGWRHLLMAFKPSESENTLLAAIQRPHVDRFLNLYEWRGNNLEVVSQLTGFSTHMAGSRNLDGVLGMDINQDGVQDIILPCTTHDTLFAVTYQETET